MPQNRVKSLFWHGAPVLYIPLKYTHHLFPMCVAKKRRITTLAPLCASVLCRVTITDVQGGAHVVEVRASSVYQAIAEAIKRKGGSFATDGYRPIKVLIYEPKKEYEVRLSEMMKWVNRHGRSPREIVAKGRIKKILGLN